MPRAWLALLLGSATGQRTPAQRVYDELEAQVAFFPQITTSAEAAQVVAETLSHPYGLALLNGRVFARDHAGITRPYLRHLRLLLDAAASLGAEHDSLVQEARGRLRRQLARELQSLAPFRFNRRKLQAHLRDEPMRAYVHYSQPAA